MTMQHPKYPLWRVRYRLLDKRDDVVLGTGSATIYAADEQAAYATACVSIRPLATAMGITLDCTASMTARRMGWLAIILYHVKRRIRR